MVVILSKYVNKKQSRGIMGIGKLTDKPDSVVDSHSSRYTVTCVLKQPTRRLGEQRHSLPIWSCSGWRLPRFTVT